MTAGVSSESRLTAAACFGMLVFGIVMALLGAVLPFLGASLGVRLDDAGRLFVWMNLAMLLSSSILGRWIDRSGLKLPMAQGPVLVAAALLLLAASQHAGWPLYTAACLLGVGGGMLNTATNTLVADLHADPARKGAALNRLGIFFGFGALLLPLLIGTLVSRLGWRVLLAGSAVLALAAAAYSGALRFPDAKAREKAARGEVRALLVTPVVLLLGALLLLESGCEFTLGGFLSSYLAREGRMGEILATVMLALYWAALMGGRWSVSRMLARVRASRVITGCATLAAASLVAARMGWGVAATAAAVLLLGFGVSAIYPTALGIAGAAFPQRSGTVFGILFTLGLAGGMAMPWAAGRIGEAAGLRMALLLPACAFVLIALLAATTLAGRRES